MPRKSPRVLPQSVDGEDGEPVPSLETHFQARLQGSCRVQPPGRFDRRRRGNRRRHMKLIDHLPCATCSFAFEDGVTQLGEQSVAAVWCEHRNVYALWSFGNLFALACASAEQAARYEQQTRHQIRNAESL